MTAADGGGGQLARRIEASLAGATPAERRIGDYFLEETASLPFETAGSLARKVGVSEASVGRYCRRLGYRHFKDVKAALRDDGGDRPWLGGERLKAFAAGAAAEGTTAALEREIAAIVANHELAASEAFRAVARRLARAPRVFVAGFQTERGHALFLQSGLHYLRPDVFFVDLAAGHFAEVLADAPAGAALVLFDARRYSALTRELARRARAAGLAVTLIADRHCDWGRDVAAEVLAVDTDLAQFWDATAPMASLACLLVNAVFAELGPDVEARMTTVSSLYDAFVGHAVGSRRVL